MFLNNSRISSEVAESFKTYMIRESYIRLATSDEILFKMRRCVSLKKKRKGMNIYGTKQRFSISTKTTAKRGKRWEIFQL